MNFLQSPQDSETPDGLSACMQEPRLLFILKKNPPFATPIKKQSVLARLVKNACESTTRSNEPATFAAQKQLLPNSFAQSSQQRTVARAHVQSMNAHYSATLLDRSRPAFPRRRNATGEKAALSIMPMPVRV